MIHTRTLSAVILLVAANFAHATIVDLSIGGGDAIFLAGRTDLVIPPANLPWPGGMVRHVGATPEEILESVPPSVAVTAGDVIRLLDPAQGGINFFNSFGPPYFGPEGSQGDCAGGACSDLNAFGGISGYRGPEGALAGVFLNDDIPLAGAPVTLDFSTSGLTRDFTELSPLLAQVFYIGNGVTTGGDFQRFIAPVGATRLFLGIPDGFGFDGAPGAYDDNDGAYRVRLGINEIPSVPEPGTLALGGLALLVAGMRRRGTRVR
ncbi:MAG: PEP-CTERM sorting domain-containing protein [Gammaproteobacteria bacterium]